ncbi:MAG: hypothetical protein WC231_06435 [Dehalococcoidales bacterium]|nr:hypothetical protein [Dehalococcoidales bacterium]NLE90856.1 hypothetical protein [Dehalococcoidales bacterium]
MEKTISVIPGAYRPKSFGRKDSFTIICTNERTILAQFTSQMMKTAVKEARDKAKEEGKGFFGQWGAQMTSTSNYHQRYWEMSPADILTETEGNFDLPHPQLDRLKAKKKVEHDEDSFEVKTELQFETARDKYKFMIDSYSKEFIEELRKIYADKVQT